MRYWVKLWTEMLDDPKMGRLTDRQHRLCTNLFSLAGIIDDEGRMLNTADIAYKVRRDPDSVAEDLAALAAVNIVEQVDGAWYLINFGKRNERPPSADREAVRERVAKSREKKQECNEDVTTCNEDVTRALRDVTSLEQEQIRSEADQTRARTEVEQEQEGDQKPVFAQCLPASSSDALALLLALPMEEPNASKVASAGLDYVRGWLSEFDRRAKNGRPVHNPPGLLFSMWEAGKWPDKPPGNGRGNPGRRSLDGKYGDIIEH